MRDLSWLSTRGYALPSALQLVGNRFGLSARQRQAVLRCACSDDRLARRRARRVSTEALAGRRLGIDGFNVLTTLEGALGGAAILIGRDRCARDVLGLAGTWRRVRQTRPSIGLVARFLAEARAEGADWFLDRAVSNSGRLRQLLRERAQAEGLDWSVTIAADADAALLQRGGVVASADRRVLDGCEAWHNLACEVIRRHVPAAWTLDLARPPAGD